METMGHLLPLFAHPNRPTRHQGPNPLPTNPCSQVPHRCPCRQTQAHPQKKRGAIHPLRGTDICVRGGPRPKTQHHGRHQFSPGTTVCDPHEIRSSPPEEYAPSLSPFSTAWTQLPKADRLEEEQLQTSPGSLSYSSSDPENTARV